MPAPRRPAASEQRAPSSDSAVRDPGIGPAPGPPTFEVVPGAQALLPVRLGVAGGAGGPVRVLQVGRARPLLGGVRVTEGRVALVQLQGLDGRRVVVHAQEGGAGGTELVGAGAIPAALGQLVVVAFYEMLGGGSLPVPTSQQRDASARPGAGCRARPGVGADGRGVQPEAAFPGRS